MVVQEAVVQTSMYETARVVTETPVTQQRAGLRRIRAQLQAEIARREFLETQLQQMQAIHAIDMWIGSLAHEIKNPLTSIRTFVQLVSLKHHDYHFVEKFERIVLQELDRIDLLVNDLLQLAKPLRLQPALVHIPTILHRVVEVYSEHLHLQEVVLHTDFAASLPPLHVDAEQLYRVCANIVLNAIEAMPAGGALRLACRPLSGRQEETTAETVGAEIIFSDTGVGMSTEQLRTLFTPFQTTKSTGTGLGLALTYKIIKAHGGSIHVTSAVGHGTVVTVTLPATPVPRLPTA
jgi:two-component system nitrogen regulation sensor histidine kinase GlnL